MIKKLLLTVLSFFFCIGMFAQFPGGFSFEDKGIIYDSDPCFVCQNLYTYNGYGQNLANVTLVINDEYVFNLNSYWEYGSYLYLGKSNGVDFSSGDVVALYINGQYINSWKYSRSLANFALPKGTGKAFKKLWKTFKKSKFRFR